MSVTAVPLRPLTKGAVLKLWIGILLVVLLGAGLAWLSTAHLRYSNLEDGVRYRVLSAGTGEPLGADDLARLDFELLGADGEVIESTRSRVDPQSGRVGAAVPVPLEAFPDPVKTLKDRLREGGVYQFVGPAAELLGEGLPPGLEPRDQIEFRLNIVGIDRGGLSRARRMQEEQMQQQMLQQQMMEEMGRSGRVPGAPPAGPGAPPAPGGR